MGAVHASAAAVPAFFSRRLGCSWGLPANHSAIMAIVNVTPDSFSDGGHYQSPEAIWQRVQTAIAQGADLLDFGAESTRPGAKPVSDAEQLLRLAPVFEILPHVNIPVSIDTRSAVVAAAALERGFEIVNDVSGGATDQHLAAVVGEHGAIAIVMHSRGTPLNMDSLTQYNNIATDIYGEWHLAARRFYAAGLKPEHVWFDPGFGFAKNVDQCWQLLGDLARGNGPANTTLVVGLSRKRFVDVMQLPASARDAASNAALALLAARRRAIFRVHDVIGAVQAARTACLFSQKG